MSGAVRQAIIAQYATHKSWSVRLHHDNLVALAESNPDLLPLPSYATLGRFLKANGFSDYPLALFKADHIRVLRNRKKDTTAAANHRLRDLNLLFSWLLKNEKGGVKSNPAHPDLIDKFERKDAGHHHVWTDAEREQYCARHLHGSLARRCFDLLFFAGPAVCDAIRMGVHAVDGNSLSFQPQEVRQAVSCAVEGDGDRIHRARHQGRSVSENRDGRRDAGMAPRVGLSIVGLFSAIAFAAM
jgi:hypothetical protein